MSKVVGLEIGLTNTKVVIGNKNKDNFEMLDYRIMENSEGMHDFDGHLVLNEAAPKLSQLIKDIGGIRKKCYLTVSSPKSIVRNRLFPYVKKKELDAMVQIEAEQFLPYDLNSFYVDYRVLGLDESGDQKNLNVMVVAVPKEIIDEAVELVEKCKMRLECVNVFVDAIQSYHAFYAPAADANTLIADIGHHHLRMIAFKGHEYFANINSETGIKSFEDFYHDQFSIPHQMLRDYMFKGLDLPRDIYKKFTEDDHQRDFATLSFSSGDFQEHSDEEDDTYDKSGFVLDYNPIVNEIHKMLGFFRSRKYGAKVDRILLCGGGAHAKGLKEAIAENTAIDTVLMTYPGQENNRDATLLATAIGGILRG